MTEHAAPQPTPPVPLMTRYEPDTSPTASLSDPRNQTAIATAVTSIVVWALTRYLSAPVEVTAAVALLVPAGIAWFGSHLAFKKTPPRIQTPIHAQPGPQNGGQAS